nr:MAG TPA: hypothetical protein [Caudoviricetes sp.]
MYIFLWFLIYKISLHTKCTPTVFINLQSLLYQPFNDLFHKPFHYITSILYKNT